jgi:TPR repeat protein
MSGATVLPAGKSIPPGADRAAAARFQESIGDDPTGSLTPEQIVRLVQTAAVNGDATSQTELGVMYTQGIGVPVNYNRAQHWFEAARRQRYGLAMAYLGHLLERPHPGVTGDNNRALALFGEARSAGYDPGRYALTIRDDRDDRDRGDRRRDRGDRDAREESGNDPAPRSDSDGAAQ